MAVYRTVTANATLSDNTVQAEGTVSDEIARVTAVSQSVRTVASSDYGDLTNKPKINSHILEGDKSSADLGLASADLVGDLKSAFEDYENNTFTVITPTDYGALITASDCTATKTGLTFADTENGILLTKTERVNMGAYFYFNDLPDASAASPVNYDFTITFDDLTGIDAVYFYDGSTQVGSYSGGTITKTGNTYKFNYTYSNQSVLRWQIGLLYSFQSTKNVTSITGVDSSAVDKYCIIPETIEWYLNQRDGIEYNANYPTQIASIYDFSTWTQGACAVGDKWVGFGASGIDHSTQDGKVSIGSFPLTNQRIEKTHNLGHCASADYNERYDTIIIGNCATETVTPEITLIQNVSSFVATPDNLVYSNMVNIQFSDIDGAGKGCIACFGEAPNVCYIVTSAPMSSLEDNATRYIYRVILGTGTADMTSLYADDSYGTYSASSTQEFNGTAHITDKYEVSFKGEFQGLKYYSGLLYFPVDFRYNNILTGWVIVVGLGDISAVIKSIRCIPTIKPDGTQYHCEVEDIVEYNGKWYIPTILREQVGGSVIYQTVKFTV